MTTLGDIKSAFYDYQRQTANMFEALVAELAALNVKAKEEAKEAKHSEKVGA